MVDGERFFSFQTYIVKDVGFCHFPEILDRFTQLFYLRIKVLYLSFTLILSDSCIDLLDNCQAMACLFPYVQQKLLQVGGKFIYSRPYLPKFVGSVDIYRLVQSSLCQMRYGPLQFLDRTIDLV